MSYTVSDYIFDYLSSKKIDTVFGVVGGGAMFLNDSIARNKDMRFICCHHEQAAGFAAEGYARVNNTLGVACVTTGPGSTNAITSTYSSWVDSVPVLYVAGQIKYPTSLEYWNYMGLRQLGDQEVDIIPLVKPITKYCTYIREAYSIKYELEEAIRIATTGRYGPVWIVVPLDIQSSEIDLEKLNHIHCQHQTISITSVPDISQVLQNSKAPLVIAGHGIHLSNSRKKFLEFINNTHIPVVTTFNGFDCIPSIHEMFVGRIGTLGTRAGNIILQNADTLLCLGTRNNIRQVSYNWNDFGRKAQKLIVDIDPAELHKPLVQGDYLINCSVSDFLKVHGNLHLDPSIPWISWCKEIVKKYDDIPICYGNTLNPYSILRYVTELLDESSIVVSGNGTACVVLFQSGVVKNNQRFIWNSGCAAMGYDLPAAIGAHFSSGKSIICITGDGSIMMNLQELQTISHYHLPIKIFVLNNNGYQSIKQTQSRFFNENLIGCSPNTGVSFPSFEKLADTFSLPFFSIEKSHQFDIVKTILNFSGPLLCEIILDSEYEFQPRVSSYKKEDGTLVSSALDNMYPFLSTQELMSNIFKL